jgi:hypothetical protein
LLSKRVAGCTEATLGIYAWWLRWLIGEIPEVTSLAVRRFFAGLQHRSPSVQHQAYRTLKTFFRWCVKAGALSHPGSLRGFTMRTPKTLPDVPTDDELRAVFLACPDTLEGTRNQTLILVLAAGAPVRTRARARVSCRAAVGLGPWSYIAEALLLAWRACRSPVATSADPNASRNSYAGADSVYVREIPLPVPTHSSRPVLAVSPRPELGEKGVAVLHVAVCPIANGNL